MKALQNGCYRSDICVTPANWNTAKASTKIKWRIYYRYYDPSFRNDPKLWGKQVPIKGMNQFKDLAQRQAATRILIEKETDEVDNKLFNPVTGNYMIMVETVSEIGPDTPMIQAMNGSIGMMDIVKEFKSDLESIVRSLEASAGKIFDQQLQKPYSALKIAQVSRKHLVYLLELTSKDRSLSNGRYNKFRAALLMIFRQLLQVEAVESNPVHDILIKKTTRKKRKLLTASERLIIDTNLKARDYYYWRYMRIFFRSGSRSTEMLALKKGPNVDLEAQEFTVLVKKGQEFRESIRPITDDVFDLWREVWEEAETGQHLFSIGFRPGAQKIGRDNVDKRWKEYVKWPESKGGMNIQKDFYSLKALNADTIAAMMDIEHAAAADGHASSETTSKHYAVNEQQRKIDRLKKVNIDFV